MLHCCAYLLQVHKAYFTTTIKATCQWRGNARCELIFASSLRVCRGGRYYAGSQISQRYGSSHSSSEFCISASLVIQCSPSYWLKLFHMQVYAKFISEILLTLRFQSKYMIVSEPIIQNLRSSKAISFVQTIPRSSTTYLHDTSLFSFSHKGLQDIVLEPIFSFYVVLYTTGYGK